MVISGITIGHGAIIGAGSVVTHDVEPYAIVYGNPARFKRFRFDPETIAQLLENPWWDRELEEIRNLPFDHVQGCLDILASKIDRR